MSDKRPDQQPDQQPGKQPDRGPRLPTLLLPGGFDAAGALPDETPLAFIQRWIRARLPDYGGHDASLANRVLVVQAKTGSGKSTVLPVGVLRIVRDPATPRGVRLRRPGVICTQPRVLTAVALATDVSVEHSPWNRDMILSESVGFQTGPVSNAPPSGLLFATAGVLAAQLRGQTDAELMERYQFVLVDEAHERAVDSDLMLFLLRAFLLRNAGSPRLPFVLLLSATFDPARYAAYFGVGTANVVTVEGQPFPIRDHWPDRGTNAYPAAAAEAVLRIHAENPGDPPERADILVFVPGGAESRAVADRLLKAQEAALAAGGAAAAPYLVLTINREVIASQTGDFPLVFARPDRLPLVGGRRPARRVVVSTVVAETGLTIDTLRHVVDCGWSRTREAYQPWGAAGLVTRPAAQSRIRQRKGRAGRLFPGEFYPLYTQNVHAALDPQQLPDIVTVGCADVFLGLVQEQQRQKALAGLLPEFRVEDIALLDPPPPEALLAALATATALGFVSARAPLAPRPEGGGAPAARRAAPREARPLETARGFGLTPLGALGAAFARTSMEGVRVLLAGYTWGAAAPDLVTAVAAFGVPPRKLFRPELRAPPGALPPGAEALRAALPAFLAQRVGGGGRAPAPPAESELFYYRARLLLADDFAETVLVFDAFARRADAAGSDLAGLAGWCESLGLSLGRLLELARRREELIEEMLVAGLNPFRGAERCLGALPAAGFVEGLARLKRCLHDGLRGRLLRFSEGGPGGAAYVTRQGLRVRTPSLLTDALAARLRAIGVTGAAAPDWKPRWILTDEVRLVARAARGGAPPPLLYDVETNLVSVLDGFVAPDPDFGEARAFPGADEALASRPAPADETLASRLAPAEGRAAGVPPGLGRALPGKIGPAGAAPSAEEAAGRLEAYARAAGAALAAREGPLAAPVLALADEQLAALFAPDQAEKLVWGPFGRERAGAAPPL